jgi:hypothetical protein
VLSAGHGIENGFAMPFYELVDGSGSTINPYARACPHCVIAASISAASRSGAAITSTANFGAAAVASVASRTTHLMSAWGQNENRCFTGICQLPPAADIALVLASAALSH